MTNPKENFLKGVAELMEHGKTLETEERRLDDEIEAAGLDPEAYVKEFSAFMDRQIGRERREQTADRPGRLSSWLGSLSRALAPRKAWAMAAAGLALAVMTWTSRGGSAAAAAEMLNQGAQRLAALGAIHIQARMRTLPRDNFEYVGLKDDFVSLDMWKRYGATPQWRVEKPGRVVVMDGQGSTLLIKPGTAAKGGPKAGFVEWLRPLLDIEEVLHHEVDLAAMQGSKLSMKRERGETLVTVEAKAQGDFAHDWLKNKSIVESDNRRVYRFDAQTQRLKGLQVFVHSRDGDVLVFEITGIEYDPTLADSLFALTLPKDVTWLEEPKPLADEPRYTSLGPGEMARAFFQACADKNWVEAVKFFPIMARKDLQETFGGLRIVSIGAPFRSGLYRGYFVPYEVRLPSGRVKKWNLAVRNDNPAKRFVVDGGF